METKEEIFDKAIEIWGIRSQLEMAQEESTELALAVRKFIRTSNEKRFNDMAGEIADVEIMIEQIKRMYPEIKYEIEDQKVFKINRLKERLLKLIF